MNLLELTLAVKKQSSCGSLVIVTVDMDDISLLFVHDSCKFKGRENIDLTVLKWAFQEQTAHQSFCECLFCMVSK